MSQSPISILREFQNNPTGGPYAKWKDAQDALDTCRRRRGGVLRTGRRRGRPSTDSRPERRRARSHGRVRRRGSAGGPTRRGLTQWTQRRKDRTGRRGVSAVAAVCGCLAAPWPVGGGRRCVYRTRPHARRGWLVGWGRRGAGRARPISGGCWPPALYLLSIYLSQSTFSHPDVTLESH